MKRFRSKALSLIIAVAVIMAGLGGAFTAYAATTYTTDNSEAELKAARNGDVITVTFVAKSELNFGAIGFYYMPAAGTVLAGTPDYDDEVFSADFEWNSAKRMGAGVAPGKGRTASADTVLFTFVNNISDGFEYDTKYTFSMLIDDAFDNKDESYAWVGDTFEVSYAEYTVKFMNGEETVDTQYVVIGECAEAPADPEKTGYDFTGWKTSDGAVFDETKPVSLAAVYEAQWTPKKYTVKFVNYDGEVLQTGKVEYDTMPAYEGAAPQRAADAQYTYTFKEWSPEVTKVTDDATYTATYSTTVNKYLVEFVDEDGTELQSSEVEYGTTPEYSGTTPSKTADADHVYEFDGWDPAIESVTRAATYTAKYAASNRTYDITEWAWTGSDETGYTAAKASFTTNDGVTPSATQSADAEITEETTDATCTEDGSTVYTASVAFKGKEYTDVKTVSIPATGHAWGEPSWTWAEDYSTAVAKFVCKHDNSHVEEISAVVSSAQGSGEDVGYTIYTAVAELGGKEYIEVQKVINTYTVKFLNYDGTTLQTLTAEHGSTPEYTGSEPAREKTAQYSYSFIGWDPEIIAATEDAEYTAQFEETINEYTVKFVNYDGTELQSSKVAYGQTPEYKGDEPERPADARYTYAFSGWTPEIAAVSEDATYTATYTETQIGYRIIVTDYTKGGATTSIDPEEYYSGDVSFSVASDKAVVVAAASGEENVSYERMYCTEADGTHTFTLTMPGGTDVHLVIGFKGDINLDGSNSLKDSSLMCKVYVGTAEVDALQILFGDIDGNGSVSLRDASYAAKVYVDTYTCLWDIK